MERCYTVQNPHKTTASTKAVVNGKELTVSVDAFECELVADDTMQGTIKLRVIGDEVPGAQELFAQDSKIKVTFSQ